MVRQLLAESLVLSVAGAVLGACLAYPASALLVRLISGSAASAALSVDVNWTVLFFHVITAVAAVGLFGAVPALVSKGGRLLGVAVWGRQNHTDGGATFVSRGPGCPLADRAGGGAAVRPHDPRAARNRPRAAIRQPAGAGVEPTERRPERRADAAVPPRGPLAAGLLTGTAAAAILTRYAATLLYGLPPLDPVSFALGIIGICVVVTAAASIPARRAARLDPALTLREG
jgi:hypothetical protein